MDGDVTVEEGQPPPRHVRARSQGMRAAPGAGKGQETDSPLEAPEGCSPAHTLKPPGWAAHPGPSHLVLGSAPRQQVKETASF